MKPLIGALVLLASTLAFAEGGGSDEPLPKPCQTIANACQAAGYHHGGHKEGKGLWKDCVAPILDGKTIPGVTANPADIKACSANPNRG
ncbi:MAG TPA: hypothetical protein VGL86_09920 [Polyangia bacterium]